MKFLILAEQDNVLALAVNVLLQQRHSETEVRLVTLEEALFAPHWRHSIDEHGLKTRIELTDSTVLDFSQIGVVFNLIAAVRAPHFDNAHTPDREYALSELQALWLSWLSSLPCPIINRATPRGLCTPWIGQFEWCARAMKVGLPVRNIHISSNSRRYHDKNKLAYPPSAFTEPFTQELKPLTNNLLASEPAVYLEAISNEQEGIIIGDTVLGAPETLDHSKLIHFARDCACDLLQFGYAWQENKKRYCITRASGLINHSDSAVVTAIADLLEKRVHQ